MTVSKKGKELYIGYISSSPFWYGTYIPQRVQNIIIRDYCRQNNLSFSWSLPEVSAGVSTFAISQLLRDIPKEVSGFIFISIRMHTPEVMQTIIEEILSLHLTAHFGMENISVTSAPELTSLMRLLRVSNLLSNDGRLIIKP